MVCVSMSPGMSEHTAPWSTAPAIEIPEAWTPGGRVVALASTIVIAAVLTAVLARFGAEPHGAEVIGLNALLLGICLFPGLRWYTGSRGEVPIFEAICLSYAVHFGLTGLLRPNQFIAHFTDAGALVPFTEDELAGALLATIAGILAFQLAYTALMKAPWSARVAAIDIPLQRDRLHVYLFAAVLGGLVIVEARGLSFTPSSDSPLGALINVLASQFTVGVAILTYLFFGGQEQRRVYRVLLLIGVVGGIWLALTTAMFESLIVIPFAIAVISLQLRRKFMLLIMGALAIAYLVLLQPVKLEYRRMLASSSIELNFVQRMTLWYDAFASFVTSSNDGLDESQVASQIQAGAATSSSNPVETARTSLARVDYIHLFELVRVDTPALIPHYEGVSYRYFFVGWIPRALWPDKPSALEDNNRLILDYGVLSDNSQQVTTAGFGMLPEAYINFGDLGMVVVMAIQGAALGALFRAFTVRRSMGAQAVLLSVSMFLVNGVGGITTIMYSGLLQNLVANALLLWLGAGRAEDIRAALRKLTRLV